MLYNIRLMRKSYHTNAIVMYRVRQSKSSIKEMMQCPMPIQSERPYRMKANMDEPSKQENVKKAHGKEWYSHEECLSWRRSEGRECEESGPKEMVQPWRTSVMEKILLKRMLKRTDRKDWYSHEERLSWRRSESRECWRERAGKNSTAMKNVCHGEDLKRMRRLCLIMV